MTGKIYPVLLASVVMNRKQKEAMRRVQERMIEMTARAVEPKIRRIISRSFREAKKAYAEGKMTEPVVRQTNDDMEKELYRLFLRAYPLTEKLTRQQIATEKGLPPLERKSSIFEMAMIAFARQWAGEKAKKITSTTVEDINAVIVSGIEQNATLEQITDALTTKGIASSASRAHMIARTETHSASMAGSIEVAKESEVVEMKEWVSVFDGRTRQGDNSDFDHTNVDPVPLRSKFDVSGEFLDYPGDPSGSAGNIINCRCIVVYD
jgi:hypothetical protein